MFLTIKHWNIFVYLPLIKRYNFCCFRSERISNSQKIQRVLFRGLFVFFFFLFVSLHKNLLRVVINATNVFFLNSARTMSLLPFNLYMRNMLLIRIRKHTHTHISLRLNFALTLNLCTTNCDTKPNPSQREGYDFFVFTILDYNSKETSLIITNERKWGKK